MRRAEALGPGSEETVLDGHGDGLPFSLAGQVVKGKHLGSRLGFPTANIAYISDGRVWPPDGVYIAIAALEDGGRYAAVLNQGKHPTAPEGAPTIEAHMLGFDGHALYGQRLMLEYRVFLRPERRFSSLEELKAQLAMDRDAALAWAMKNE